jgi:hypothetical protein
MKPSTNWVWGCIAVLVGGQITGILSAAQLLRGPYLQIPTPHSITLRWRTDVPTDSLVRYGLQTNDLSFSATDGALTNEHIVQLTSLTPGTSYFYSIGSATQTLAAGIDCEFVTSPATGTTGPTRVWAFGDFGGVVSGRMFGNSNFVNGEFAVRDSYLPRQADIWLALGDLAYPAGTDGDFQTNLFEVYGTILRQLPIWPAIGNHEVYSVGPGQRFPYLDIFSFPTNGEAGGVASGREEYYSFDQANIHFICLDSETSSRETNGVMANWLRADLAANTNQWIIAYFHHAPYSKGTHDSDDNDYEYQMIEMRRNIVPILEAGGVDLVLAGHSHIYERSYLLHGHYGYSTSLTPEMILDSGSGRENETGAYIKPDSGPLANRGTVYVVVGTGCCLEGQLGHHPAIFKDEAQLGTLLVEVNSNRLDAKFVRETGTIDDSFTIIKGSREDLRLLPLLFQNGNTIVRWKSVPGESYRVEQNDTSGWRPVSDPIPATGATTSWTNIAPAGSQIFFYRIQQLLPPTSAASTTVTGATAQVLPLAPAAQRLTVWNDWISKPVDSHPAKEPDADSNGDTGKAIVSDTFKLHRKFRPKFQSQLAESQRRKPPTPENRQLAVRPSTWERHV